MKVWQAQGLEHGDEVPGIDAVALGGLAADAFQSRRKDWDTPIMGPSRPNLAWSRLSHRPMSYHEHRTQLMNTRKLAWTTVLLPALGLASLGARGPLVRPARDDGPCHRHWLSGAGLANRMPAS